MITIPVSKLRDMVDLLESSDVFHVNVAICPSFEFENFVVPAQLCFSVQEPDSYGETDFGGIDALREDE